MLSRIGVQDVRIADALRSVDQARENTFNPDSAVEKFQGD
jgi:hypothetical protein